MNLYTMFSMTLCVCTRVSIDMYCVQERLHGPVIVDGDLKLPIKLSVREIVCAYYYGHSIMK